MNKVYTKIVIPFAIVETIVWATYFYSFPAFLPTWETNLGFSRTVLTGAFTISLIVSALCAPFIGRLIDKGFGKQVFSGGTILAVIMLLFLSKVTEVWQFYAVWFGLGIAMSGSLYEACFAIITHSLGGNAKRAITIVTLIAGFAGTISFPSSHFLIENFGWRFAIIVFGFVVGLICTPLVIYSTQHAKQQSKVNAPKTSLQIFTALGSLSKLSFWLIGITFTLLAFNHGIVLSHILPILFERGFSNGFAILVASSIGPMQVIGRFIMFVFEKKVSTITICLVCFGSIFIAGWSLYFSNIITTTIFLFVITQGCGYGVLSIIRPTVIAEILGRRDFGIISGILATGFVLGSAMGPILGSIIWVYGGYDSVIGIAILIPILAIISIVGAWKFKHKNKILKM